MAKQMLIDVTPTWVSLMPDMFRVLESGKEEQKKVIRSELVKLAVFADRINGISDSEMVVRDGKSLIIRKNSERR